jgi:hypothetical protein
MTWILVALLTKHFICDFPLQVPFHYLNKGTYGHIGGIHHALIHLIGTFIALVWFTGWQFAAMMAVLDGFIHYHIDWAKMNLNKHFNWKPDNSEKFWWLLGFDQYLHGLTYVLILALI